MPIFTAGLYRKCECRQDDTFPIANFNASDYEWSRGSIGNIEAVTAEGIIYSKADEMGRSRTHSSRVCDLRAGKA